MRRRAFLFLGASSLSTACIRALRTPTAWQSQSAPPASKMAANPSAGMWPDALGATPAATQEAYKWAAVNRATLRYIPCYCGCAGIGHKDNFDCYVSEIRDGGWLVLSDHALG
ncbi:MAG: hypothetical protein KGN00_01390 [Chloroflexota bacterium]|nr:hypothetical protein [Chloroflexota bacterium]MDE3192316.1 hypothetical protein [Chloroflexota bacterium]